MSSRLGTRPRSRRSLRWPRLGDGPGARRAGDDQEVHPGERCPALGTSGTFRDGQDADRLDVGRIGWVRLALAAPSLAVRPAHLDNLDPVFPRKHVQARLVRRGTAFLAGYRRPQRGNAHRKARGCRWAARMARPAPNQHSRVERVVRRPQVLGSPGALDKQARRVGEGASRARTRSSYDP